MPAKEMGTQVGGLFGRAGNAQADAKSNDFYGNIIGRGKDQSAEGVAVTREKTQGLTRAGVQDMVRRGLTRDFVEGMRDQYECNLLKGGPKATGNTQLKPRLELMKKILEVWP